MRPLLASLATAALLLVANAPEPAQAAWPLGPLSALPSFNLSVGDRRIEGDTGSVTASPGEALELTATSVPAHADLVLDAGKSLTAERDGPRRWHVRIGEWPGIHRLTVRNRTTGAQLPVSVFVREPFDATADEFDGYRIGHYQPAPHRGDPLYDPPTALLRIDRDDVGDHLSPDFTIGQFLCHQQPEHWPKFALVRPLLIDKLEAILAALRDKGINADTLTVMSGYRTPHYNAAIGNTTRYSRHLYGGAADIFVDTNHDGEMDDLNGDGVVDIHDAEWLAELVESLATVNPRFAGGLSAYPANAHHGPFVHVDARGTAVRW